MFIESFKLRASEVQFRWMPSPVEFGPDLAGLESFIIVGIHTRNCTRTYTTGTFSCLQLTFKLQRDPGYFILQVIVATDICTLFKE